MSKVKRTIELKYVSSGIDEIQKKLKEISASGFDLDVTPVKKLMDELKAIMGREKDGVLNPADTEKLFDTVHNLALSFKKLGVEIHTVFDEDAKTSLLNFEDQLDGAYKEIKKLDRALEKVAKTIKDVQLGDLSSATNIDKKKAERIAAEAIGEEMISPTGRTMTDPTNFIKLHEEFLQELEKESALQGEILDKIKAGKELNEEELGILNEVLAGKERVKITGDELVEQNQLILRIGNRARSELERELLLKKDALNTTKEDVEAQIQGIKQVKAEVAEGVFLGTDESVIDKILELSNSIEKIGNEMIKMNSKTWDQYNKEQEKARESTKKTTEEVKKQDSTFGKAAKQVFAYGTAFTFLRRIYKETLRTIKDLDKAMTDMSVVTKMSRQEAWALVGTFQDLAKQTGMTTTEIANLSTIYFRQGRTTKDVLKLTETAAKAAKIAGISAAESADYLTAAVNGFGLAADQALAVSDRFAALAAQSASSYEELAIGLSKFAAQARIAGISIDFAMGMLAKGIETTREAPETIGTALKTVISRMRELSDFGKTLEDGMDLNRVDKALKAVGISLTDGQGKFRDLEEVLKEVGARWEDLDKTAQASVAVALAGTRQQSRLVAIMNDFGRTLELTEMAQDSAGTTAAQHAEYMGGLEAATTKLTTSWQNFIQALSDSEIIIEIVHRLADMLAGLTEIFRNLGEGGKSFIMVMVGIVAVSTLLTTLSKLNAKAMITENSIVKLAVTLRTKLALARKADTKEAAKGTAATLGAASAAGLETIAVNANIKAIWAKIAAKLVEIAVTMWYLAIILLVIAAVAALVYGLYMLITAEKRRIEQLKKQNDELNKTIVNTQKLIKTLDSLSKKIDEINKKKIKTNIDYEDLEALADQIRQIEEDQEIEIIEYKSDGSINWEETNRKLKNYLNKQERERKNAIREKELVERELFKRGEISAAEYAGTKSAATLMSSDRKYSDKVDTEVKKYIERSLENKEHLLNEEILNFANMMQDFEESMNKENLSLGERLDLFSRQLEGLPKEQQEALKRAFPDYAGILEDKDVFKFIKENERLIEELSLSLDDINVIQELAKKTGKSPQKLIDELYREFLKTDASLPRDLRIAEAINGIAGEFMSAEEKADLFKIITIRALQEVAQEADLLTSKLKRFSEIQEKILKGDIGDEELLDFFEEYAGVFADPKMMDAFLRGDDISNIVLASKKKEQNEKYNILLEETNARLEELKYKTDEASIAEKEILKTRKAGIEYLLSYRGALSNLTKEQIEYNYALQKFNMLQQMGVDNVKMHQELVNSLEAATRSAVQRTSIQLDGFMATNSDVLEDIGVNFYEIKDGVVQIREEFWGLSDDNKKIAETFMTDLQGYLDTMSDAYLDYMNAEIALEEQKAKEKKKIYEDYFKALDRMEDKRNRKQTRESLIKQLQRLEGATDERSRKKALELKKELNKLDEDQRKDDIKESREALLDSIDKSVDKVREAFAKGWLDFINTPFEEMINSELGIGLGEVIGSTLLDSSGIGDFYSESHIKGELKNLEVVLDELKDAIKEDTKKHERLEEEIQRKEEELKQKEIEKNTAKSELDNAINKLSEIRGKIPKELEGADHSEISKAYFELYQAETEFEMMPAWQQALALPGLLAQRSKLTKLLKKAGYKNYQDYSKYASDLGTLSQAKGSVAEKQGLVYSTEQEYRDIYNLIEDEKDGLKAQLRRVEKDLENHYISFNNNYAKWVGYVGKLEQSTGKAYADRERYSNFINSIFDDLERIGFLPEEVETSVNNTISNLDKLGEYLENYVTDKNSIEDIKDSQDSAEVTRGRGRGKRTPTKIDKDEPIVLSKTGNYIPLKFSKGGKVDYTGLAMLHGSKTNPEAVLNPNQTKMFMGLRDTLERVGDTGVGGIAIGSITISPKELNNNQDWKKAGQLLAQELQAGLRRTGINLNKKR